MTDQSRQEVQVQSIPQVLLIDDEEVVREIGEEMLDSLGYRCLTAAGGEEGIRLFEMHGNNIMLVILDIEMPGLSGDKVYDCLKKLDPNVKILVISGYSKNYLETKYFKRKIEYFMPKPFQLEQLTSNINVILAGEES